MPQSYPLTRKKRAKTKKVEPLKLKTEQDVIKHVQFKAEYFPNNPSHLKYMVKLNGKGIGASDTDTLVVKICKKLEILVKEE